MERDFLKKTGKNLCFKLDSSDKQTAACLTDAVAKTSVWRKRKWNVSSQALSAIMRNLREAEHYTCDF